MAAKIYYEQDAPIDGLKAKKVAVIGYGSQGHAHSQNLRDSGIDVAVAELEGTDNFKLAQEHGFAPADIKTAMSGAALTARSRKIILNEVGYHAVNMSMMLSGASWAVIATLPLIRILKS